jgi:hypothetical protein
MWLRIRQKNQLKNVLDPNHTRLIAQEQQMQLIMHTIEHKKSLILLLEEILVAAPHPAVDILEADIHPATDILAAIILEGREGSRLVVDFLQEEVSDEKANYPADDTSGTCNCG